MPPGSSRKVITNVPPADTIASSKWPEPSTRWAIVCCRTPRFNTPCVSSPADARMPAHLLWRHACRHAHEPYANGAAASRLPPGQVQQRHRGQLRGYRADFEAAWHLFLSACTDADFQAVRDPRLDGATAARSSFNQLVCLNKQGRKQVQTSHMAILSGRRVALNIPDAGGGTPPASGHKPLRAVTPSEKRADRAPGYGLMRRLRAHRRYALRGVRRRKCGRTYLRIGLVERRRGRRWC